MHIHIYHMPYINLTEQEVIVGNVKIWNFDELKNIYITDEKTRETISRYLAKYVEGKRPIANIGIISIGEPDFRQFTEKELEEVREAKFVLFLSSLSKSNINHNNIPHALITADNFIDKYTILTPKTKHFSVRDGSLISSMRGGIKYSTYTAPMPYHIHLPMSFNYDITLVAKIMMLKKKKPALFRRIIRSIDFFYSSYFNESNINLHTRIVQQATAFEILFNLQDEKGKREKLKKKISALCDLPNDSREEYCYKKSKGQKSDKPENVTKKHIWGDHFYFLRDMIVHGDVLRKSNFLFGKQPFILSVTIFFVVCIKKMINLELKEKVFWDEVYWEKTKFVHYSTELGRIMHDLGEN